jgi:hypothetical protein
VTLAKSPACIGVIERRWGSDCKLIFHNEKPRLQAGRLPYFAKVSWNLGTDTGQLCPSERR